MFLLSAQFLRKPCSTPTVYMLNRCGLTAHFLAVYSVYYRFFNCKSLPTRVVTFSAAPVNSHRLRCKFSPDVFTHQIFLSDSSHSYQEFYPFYQCQYFLSFLFLFISYQEFFHAKEPWFAIPKALS